MPTRLMHQFTVGKLDAGVAILLSPDHHVVEFPATILPDDVTTGSIVNIAIERNDKEETKRTQDFLSLQESIYETFGKMPIAPVIKIRSVTQTTVVLEWEPLQLFQADFRGIDVYRNTAKLSLQVSKDATLVKISGLDIEHTYDFHIVVRTSAGALKSNTVSVQTHTMENLAGLNVCLGDIPDEEEVKTVKELVEKVGGKYSTELALDNTHFVTRVGKGDLWNKARDMNVPIVNPDFVKNSHNENKLQPVGPYYVPAEVVNSN